MPEPTLMDKTIELFNTSTLSAREIEAATKIPYHWLIKFGKREFKDPSVNRTQTLYEFLSGTKINLG